MTEDGGRELSEEEYAHKRRWRRRNRRPDAPTSVIPAKAGVLYGQVWVPAFAGMTEVGDSGSQGTLDNAPGLA